MCHKPVAPPVNTTEPMPYVDPHAGVAELLARSAKLRAQSAALRQGRRRPRGEGDTAGGGDS